MQIEDRPKKVLTQQLGVRVLPVVEERIGVQLAHGRSQQDARNDEESDQAEKLPMLA